MDLVQPLPEIVIFDDEEANLRLYSSYLKSHFKVTGCQNPHLYPQLLHPELSAVLIDVQMPVMDGPELYRNLQTSRLYNGCPVLFISSSHSEKVMNDALLSGGHDFLLRSMPRDELILRIQNKINFHKHHRQIFCLGSLRLCTKQLRATLGDEFMDLTLTEFKIMKTLIQHHPALLTRDEINQEVWPNVKVLPTTLNTHLSNLRNKFAHWEYEIVNLKGKGIQLLAKKIV
jgi:DNA-binding response OmpR family regulator